MNILENRRRWFALVAIVAALSGGLVVRRSAHACDCAENMWRLSLRAVTADAANASHEPYWPREAQLTSYPGQVQIWGSGDSHLQLGTVRAEQ